MCCRGNKDLPHRPPGVNFWQRGIFFKVRRAAAQPGRKRETSRMAGRQRSAFEMCRLLQDGVWWPSFTTGDTTVSFTQPVPSAHVDEVKECPAPESLQGAAPCRLRAGTQQEGGLYGYIF